MAIANIKGFNLYYEQYGEGEPLVFIAGFSGNHTYWQLVTESLAHHYRVILFDNRGAGQTDTPIGPYTIDQMAQDVVALLDELALEKAHIIGHSMGGMIAQQLAGHYANRVNSVIISNSATVADERSKLFFTAQYQLKQQLSVELITINALGWSFSRHYLAQPGVIEQLIQLQMEDPTPFTLDAYEYQLAAMNAFDSTSWIQQISVPCLVIGSDEDAIFPQHQSELADHIPQARYVSFDRCGHVPFIEHPEKFCQVVTDFITASS